MEAAAGRFGLTCLLPNNLRRNRRGRMGRAALLPQQRFEQGKRSQQSQVKVKKAKALWATKAAKDRSEEYYDPARKEDILGR